MKRIPILALALITILVITTGIAAAIVKFEARMSGAFEVPVVVGSEAKGKAQFKLSRDGQSISYKIEVQDINNAFMAHIHLAPVGVNGPIVVWLYPQTAFPLPASTPPPSWLPGKFSGRLVKGVFTAADLTGPLAGQPLSALLDSMMNGNAYVNVHTNDFVAPTNTGPGDFPGGEIRGQINQH